jgi:hypothetical protein
MYLAFVLVYKPSDSADANILHGAAYALDAKIGLGQRSDEVVAVHQHAARCTVVNAQQYRVGVECMYVRSCPLSLSGACMAKHDEQAFCIFSITPPVALSVMTVMIVSGCV